MFSGINGNEIEDLRVLMTGNGNGNKIMGMGGNRMPKVIPAHLYCEPV